MISVIISAVISFISTNIDDILVLMILFSKADSKEKRKHIFIGQYIGIGILVLISVLGALGLSIVPEKYVGFLGIVPIFIGINEFYEYKTGIEEDTEVLEIEEGWAKASILNSLKKHIPLDAVKVSMISIANIGIYIPMFRVMTPMDLVITILIFAIMIALWCIVAIKLVNYPFIKDKIEKYKGILVPVVFIALGVFILVESGALSLVMK